MSEEAPLAILDAFCAAFARRDRDGVMRLLAPDSEVAVVTSEEPLLRGHDELRRFLESYVAGATTYSWKWARRDVYEAGRVAWLLAEGTETATSGDRRAKHPYRMTMICENRDGRWMIRQVHGSSPQTGVEGAELSE
jgi:uncharacterized protein (TIGR02246 family)